MATRNNTQSSHHNLVVKQIGQRRALYAHLAAFLVVCTAIGIVLSVLSPEHVWAAMLLALVWGAGLAIHAIRAVGLGGAWELRQRSRHPDDRA